MAELASSWFEGIPNNVRKKRTFRPRAIETQSSITTQKPSPPLVSPLDETTKLSCDGSNGPISEGMHRKKLVQDGSHCSFLENKTSQNGMIALWGHQNNPEIYSSEDRVNEFILSSIKVDGHRVNSGAQPIYEQFGTSDEGMENAKKVKRVKLKVDSVTHTIRGTGTTEPYDRLNGCSARDHPSSEGHHGGPKGIDGDAHTDPLNRSSGLQGNTWTDLPKEDFSVGKSNFSMGRLGKINPSKKVDKLEPARKSKQAPNSHTLDLAREDDEVDEEIRFLEKLRNTKSSIGHEEDEDDNESRGNLQKYSRVSKTSMVTDPKRNTVLTARQRALLFGKRGPSSPDANLDFPNGLQPAPLKKEKDNLSAKELLKKAEAAQKRRLQSEKAAQKSQEDAIRKILSQDSSKKKKEDQRRKRLEVLAEEKATEALKHQSNTVRVVMAPMGTTVSFGENCIPSMFTSKPPSYPPPRENCAGPSCSNTYKYRDSKSRLPLCSLKCYKAVRERLDAESSC